MALLSYWMRVSGLLCVEKAIKRFYHTLISLKYNSPTIFICLLHGADSFGEDDPFSASQEIPHMLRNPKVFYRIHK